MHDAVGVIFLVVFAGLCAGMLWAAKKDFESHYPESKSKRSKHD